MKHFDASQKAELEPVAMVLKQVKCRADEVGAEIMVVGATARDILIRQVVGSPPARATVDIDVAVAVSSWDEVSRLVDGSQPGGAAHKFRVWETEVDIIPFGGIESGRRTITWPNEHMLDVF